MNIDMSAYNNNQGSNTNLREGFNINDFRKQWCTLKTPEQYQHLLDQFRLSAVQGLRMMGDTWAMQISIDAFRSRIQILYELQLPCFIQPDNTATHHAHSSSIKKFEWENQWLAIAHDQFNIRIHKSQIDSIWLVNKPDPEGITTSLEIYSPKEEAIFNCRNSNEANERAIWQDIITTLPMQVK